MSGDAPQRTAPWSHLEHLAAIVESSEDAIIGKDLDGVIQSWNHGAQRIFGYSPAEAIGKHISMLTPSHRADEIREILLRVSRGERIDHYRTERKTKDGRILSISLTISPIRDRNGTIVGASKIARDISEQVRNEQALHEAIADLEEFAYAASHDLQEPLRIVSTYGEMLQQKFAGKLGAMSDEYIGYIVGAAIHMDQLLENLRAFVQCSAVGEKPRDDVDANQSLDHAIAGLRAAIENSAASISRGTLPMVRMHEFQLERLFQNLIGNAIRYRSLESPRIHITAEPAGDMWKFSIQDNGIGIDRQYQEQIFGLFKRLHSSAEYSGTGMGLAICKRIVERAGGRIWVESQYGRGSTFFFTVPGGKV